MINYNGQTILLLSGMAIELTSEDHLNTFNGKAEMFVLVLGLSILLTGNLVVPSI